MEKGIYTKAQIVLKQHILYTFLCCICFISCTSKEDEIKAVVIKWNDLHNTHNAVEFRDLYADEVIFYGKQTPKETCYAIKNTFLTNEFRQDIISPVSISYYSSGTIKCDFTKRTQYRKEKIREYYCYLLLKRENGKYLVTGESDMLSDQKLNTQLNLGNLVSKPSSRRSIYITGIILLFVAGAVYWFRKKKLKQATEWEKFKEQYKAPEEPEMVNVEPPAIDKPYDENLVNKIKAAVLEEMKNVVSDNSPEKKGYLFETYVVERFDPTYFKLVNWRSDKYHKGIYAISNKSPDLEYYFNTTKHNCKIAIECKWRADYSIRKIELCRNDQLEAYWQYSKNNKIIVFIILGVGGKPDSPEDLYIIPLGQIQGPILYKNQLMKFKRAHKEANFFFNVDEEALF